MELHWPLILFTFFLCIAGGIMFGQGLATVMGKGKKTQIVSLVAAFAALVVGGIAVFLHLQHWERIFNGFGHITSGITLEFIGCIVFVVALAVFWLMMRRSETEEAPKWCGAVFMVVGVALVAVTGDSYLMSAIPAWDSPLLILYYVCDMLVMGGFASLIIAAALKSDEQVEISKKLAMVGAVAQLVVVAVFALAITNGAGVYTDLGFYFDPTLPDHHMVDIAGMLNVVGGETAAIFWAGVIVIGCIVPIVAAVILMKGGEKTNVLAVSAASLVCVLVGGICWRVILYMVAISIFAVF